MLLFMLVCVLKTVATLDQYNNGLYGNDCATVCQNINLPKLEFVCPITLFTQIKIIKNVFP